MISSAQVSRDGPFADDATIAQDDHAVGNLEHLVEPVRDVDHADAARPQPPKGDEQPRHFVGRQAGRGFVEHQDFGIRRQRAGNRHERLLGAGQVMNTQLGIDVRADHLQGARRHACAPRSSRSSPSAAESRA